ncbi:MAG: MMPL family transporter, partial [Bacteroidales bacterium]|nr:MMPL family transporter [Bacteroidales bacterium]
MSDRLRALYARIVLRHPLLTLLLVGVVALAMALGLPHFKIEASADALTLETDDDLDYFREVSQRFGGSDILVVTYRPLGVDLFSDSSLATLAEITRELGAIPGVENVQSLINVPLLFSPRIEIADLKDEFRTLLDDDVDREAAKREFRTSPIYRDLILGPDGQTTGIVATLSSDPTYLEMVRHRDALRGLSNRGDISETQKLELATLEQEFRIYRTELDGENRQRVQAVRELMDGYRDRAELFLGGPSMITADIVDYVANDMLVFGIGVLVFIIITLTAIFRQLRWVVLPLLSCALTVVVMLGWLSWVDWRLTVISSNFVLVLLIIAMAVTIHLVVRYRELHWKHPDWPQERLVGDTVSSMFVPCFYTVITSMVAFASLMVSNIRPVMDFGWMMTIGLMVAFALVFVVIPAGIMVWNGKPVRHRANEEAPFTLVFSRFTERHGRSVIGISIVIGVVATWGIAQLQVDNRFIDYFRKNTEIHQGLSVIDANLGGTTPFDIIIRKPAAINPHGGDDAFATEDPFAFDGDPFADDGYAADSFSTDPFATDPFDDDPFAEDDSLAGSGSPQAGPSYWFTRAGLDQLERLQDYLASVPEIGKVDSLVTAFHVANELMGHRLNDFELAFMRQTLSAELNDFLVSPYLDDDAGETRLAMRTVETASDLKRAELLAQLHAFMQDEMGFAPEEYRFSGLLVLYNNMLQSLYQSQVLTIGVVFFGIMVMFLALFRSLSLAIIAIVPNLLAAAMVLGGMGLAGIPLDMMTITIASITVGIGVDDSIHYIYRFQREFSVDRDYRAAMHRAHASIGRAMYYTSVIVIVGFSILG